MLKRSDLENKEKETLASYAMCSKDSRGRQNSEEEHPLRTAYQRDRDRIIHSTAFRRLEYKTQVFVNDEGDHHRTRLTHTLEVSQIGRSIAVIMGLNEDLTEAVALAHDLGHTPFGHSGEDALNELMKDNGGFEHNQQSLRVVDILESKYHKFKGLNLTWETRESIIKHTTRHDNPACDNFEPEVQPPLEGQIVEVADEIAYDNHDLDDGLRANIITEDQLMQVKHWQDASKAIDKKYTNLDKKFKNSLIVRQLINLEVTDVVKNTEKQIKQLGIKTVQDVRNAPKHILGFSEEIEEKKIEMENFLYKNMYSHYRVARMSAKAQRFIQELFQEYQKYPTTLPESYQKWAETEGLERALCDYIAGMTDRFAQDEYKRLFYPFERT